RRVGRADGLSGRAGAGAPRRGSDPARPPGPPERRLRRALCRPLSLDTRPDRAGGLRLCRRGADAFAGRQAARGRSRARAMRVVVVGGGLAGLSAALELVDAGHDVTLLEARRPRGGKAQTLPEREGDPEPPPDNGQHIALGCFTDYLEFLERIGSRDHVRRLPLELTVIDERGRGAKIGYGLGPLLRYRHVSVRDRLRIAVLLARLPRLVPREAETFGEFLRRHGQAGRG